MGLEIYGHQFNAEIEVGEDGQIKERTEAAGDWMPKFGDWEVARISCAGRWLLELGIRKQGGKRIQYTIWDIRERNLVEDKPVSNEEVDKLIHSMANKIFQ